MAPAETKPEAPKKITISASSIVFAELTKPWRTGKDEQAVRPTDINLTTRQTESKPYAYRIHEDSPPWSETLTTMTTNNVQ